MSVVSCICFSVRPCYSTSLLFGTRNGQDTQQREEARAPEVDVVGRRHPGVPHGRSIAWWPLMPMSVDASKDGCTESGVTRRPVLLLVTLSPFPSPCCSYLTNWSGVGLINQSTDRSIHASIDLWFYPVIDQ